MATINPWFWGGKSRQQFEQELQRDAVLLRDGKKAAPVSIKKVDIEAVKARKNALVRSGVLKATIKQVTTVKSSAKVLSVR